MAGARQYLWTVSTEFRNGRRIETGQFLGKSTVIEDARKQTADDSVSRITLRRVEPKRGDKAA